MQDRNTHIDDEEIEKCRSMAAIMLFFGGGRQKSRTQYALLYAVRASIDKGLQEWGTFILWTSRPIIWMPRRSLSGRLSHIGEDLSDAPRA